MIKLLKICRLPQGANYAPGINLKGIYLKKFGFNCGDYVNVDISENQIIISKTDVTNEVARMAKTNPFLSKLIDEFDLIPA